MLHMWWNSYYNTDLNAYLWGRQNNVEGVKSLSVFIIFREILNLRFDKKLEYVSFF